MQRIILASASPRRRELLSLLCNSFTVIPSDADENAAFTNATELVLSLSEQKAQAVAAKNSGIIIGADTVVELDGTVLGKPKDEQDAFDMLMLLSGKAHNVHTGVCVINTQTHKQLCNCCTTRVNFDTVTPQEAHTYIATGEPMDKAGAYGIQGKAAAFVKKIDGCYYNVVGLPLNMLRHMLQSITTY